MDVVDDIISPLRRPEYTGRNRCLPCTVVNAGLAVVAGVGVATAVRALATGLLGVLAGLVTVSIGGVLIYLRGYLVPGTPTLTERYLPQWLLTVFGKTSAASPRTDGGPDQETVLVDAGALEEHPDGPDLRLTQAFRKKWYGEITRIETQEIYRGLFHLLDVNDGAVTIEQHGTSLQAHVDGSFVGVWKSKEAFLADVGAATVLSTEYDAWSEFDPHERHNLLSGLRLYIDRCPTCGETPEFGTETIETCCKSREVATVECPDCDARLFESQT